MKVYVCYYDYGRDGNSDPVHVFSTEEAAKEWVEEDRFWKGYKELELDKEE